MNRKIIFSASAIALIATASVAQDKQDSHAKPLINEGAAILETQAEDVATLDDARRLAASEFAKADKNTDGDIDQAEFAAYLASVSENSTAQAVAGASPLTISDEFAKIAENDGAISKQELIDARVESFNVADIDKDSRLNREEKQTFVALVWPRTTDMAPEL